MSLLQKIRLLYFDESVDTALRFAELCKDEPLVEMVGCCHSFCEIAQKLSHDFPVFAQRLLIDVVVIRASALPDDAGELLKEIKKSAQVKLIGLLGGNEEKQFVAEAFDCTLVSDNADGSFSPKALELLMCSVKSLGLSLRREREQNGNAHGSPAALTDEAADGAFKLIAIGASAGGTNALTEVLSKLPVQMPPIVVVQHLPESFTDFFSKNLATRIPHRILAVTGAEKLSDGCVYIAGYNKHLEIIKGADGGLYTKCTSSEKVSGHRPSVDVLFRSVAKAAGSQAIGVILTGMGSDGAKGLLEMHTAGAYTIGQDKETSVVYGMPLAAYEIGAVTKQLPLQAISGELILLAHLNRSVTDNAK